MVSSTSYPLDEPHLEALRLECRVKLEPERAASIRYGKESWSKEPQRLARDAISSPASAASLVRDLLARAGADSAEAVAGTELFGLSIEACVLVRASSRVEWRGIRMPDVPRLISALASLTAGDRDGAMRALREVGR